MSKFKKEFIFELTESMVYQNEMGEKETNILLFKAPANKHHDQLDILRKELVSALLKTSAQTSGVDVPKESKQTIKKEKNGPLELNSDALLFILYGSDFDLTAFKETFWDMISDGLCLVDKRVPITTSLIDNIWYEDKTEILGEYTANFIVPSWMKRQLSK